MRVLGLETSCDETAAAVVQSGVRALSDVVSSQIEVHRPYGGVVPEIAARMHESSILPVMDLSLAEAGCGPGDIDAIAVTRGPGLIGALLVGLNVAKALSLAWSLPLVGVNHLEAHIYANFLDGPVPEFPFVALVVSGGHTLLAVVNGPRRVELLGETLDDAAGEAFDKISKFMGWGYPGGPAIDRLARGGDRESIEFPRAMMREGNLDFSYSGLKTAVIRYVEGERNGGRPVLDEDVAASFEAAAIEVLVAKAIVATEMTGVKKLVLGGGVASNTLLGDLLVAECEDRGVEFYCPPPGLCTDNAAMVASLGYYLLMEGMTLPLDADAVPDLSLGGGEG